MRPLVLQSPCKLYDAFGEFTMRSTHMGKRFPSVGRNGGRSVGPSHIPEVTRERRCDNNIVVGNMPVSLQRGGHRFGRVPKKRLFMLTSRCTVYAT